MTKDPAFLFYSSDFLTGTLLMSHEDKGKLITILSYMHQNGRVTEETIRLLAGSVSPNLKSKFKMDENGLWYNERLETETAKRVKFVTTRRANGEKGGRPPKKNKEEKEEEIKTIRLSNNNLMGNENRNENGNGNETENTEGGAGETKQLSVVSGQLSETIAFETFWNLYNKQVGEAECRDEWKKITGADKTRIMQHVPRYVASTPDKTFRRNPHNYLTAKGWLDEVMTKPQPPKSAIDAYIEANR